MKDPGPNYPDMYVIERGASRNFNEIFCDKMQLSAKEMISLARRQPVVMSSQSEALESECTLG
jgi:hypothetical protein